MYRKINLSNQKSSPIKTMQKAKIFIVAAEPSGDLIGAKLIKALKNRIDLDTIGIGGEKMINSGFKSIYSIQDFSVMGYAEVLTKIPLILIRMNQIIKAIQHFKPDIIITIDAPSLNFRIIRKLRKINALKNIKVIQYVAPTVWAYKAERVNEVAELYDHIITILPFEKPYFAGIPCTYSGHPAMEDQLPNKSKQEIRSYYGYDKDCKLITIAMGSRMTEIKMHMPIIIEAMKKMIEQNISFFIPTLSNLYNKIIECLQQSGLSKYCKVSIDSIEKKEIMYASDAAIVKSGTIAMECSLMKVPMIMFYKVSSISAFIINRKINIKFFNILNLISDKEIIPELIQDKFTADRIYNELQNLLYDDPYSQISNLEKAIKQLEIENKPSEIAADVILRYL